MIVADTDVLVDTLRGRDPMAAAVSAAMLEGTLATTTISVFELLSGARTAKESQRIAEMLAALAILPFDEPASAAAAECRRDLEPEGRTIGMGDYLIAGICISRSMALWTRNRKHFERISRLVLDER